MTTYRVTGTRAYLGHEPDEVFEADLDENQERRAIERGAISKSRAKPTEAEEGEQDASEQ